MQHVRDHDQWQGHCGQLCQNQAYLYRCKLCVEDAMLFKLVAGSHCTLLSDDGKMQVQHTIQHSIAQNPFTQNALV